MNHFRTYLCAICGEERSPNQHRFLLAENTWEDKLTILQWNEQMASRVGIQVACGIDHVEQLVIHWMTTGSLDYPFARTPPGRGRLAAHGAAGRPGRRHGSAPTRRTGGTSRKHGTGAGGKPAILEGRSGCAARRSTPGVPCRNSFAAPREPKRGRESKRKRRRVVRGFAGPGILAERRRTLELQAPADFLQTRQSRVTASAIPRADPDSQPAFSRSR